MQDQTVHTRTLEVGVNTVLNTIGNVLTLNAVEAILTLGHALKHLEDKTGISYASLSKDFKPDQTKGPELVLKK